MDNFVSLPVEIKKSNPGEMDKDGNYVFEVEASNENLDLQNQNILQSALKESEEYFLTNGVVSDDHQHRTRDEEGNVTTDYDKVIGEPISVRREGKRTFVKGKLYGAVKAAKPFINLLKSASSRVKASVGGIMPTILRNPDGTQTITKFMWNDLALTCTPVNSTVAPACFAKSMSMEDFCKALSTSPVSFDSAMKTGGDALIGEDLEGKKTDLKKVDEDEEDENEEVIEKSRNEEIGKADELNDMINDVLMNIQKGEIKSKEDIVSYLQYYGYSESDANEIAKDIKTNLEQEEAKMMKFTEKMNEIFKSFGKKKCETVEKAEDESKEPENDMDEDNSDDVVIDDEEINTDEEDEEDDVKKSLEDDSDVSDDFVEITDVLKSMDARIEAKDKQIEELQKSMLQLAESFQEALNQPQIRKSVMVEEKEKVEGYIAPTHADYEDFKLALCKAKKEGEIDLRKSVHLETVFQQEINYGKRMSEADKNEVIRIYKKFN